MKTHLTRSLAQAGTHTTKWETWKSGTPPASKFNIAGIDACPQSKNCNSVAMQAHRLGLRQLHTFASYMK